MINSFPSILLLLLLFQTTTPLHFTRYPHYPPYCSTPTSMQTRHIPPLNTNLSTQILQVNAIIRHGSRTPWTYGLNCWSGYNISDTSRWDCNLTTLMAPPKPRDEEAMFLFEKHYDALKPPQGNYFGGTCQMGQLLLDGYDQELFNGKILRQAYLGSAAWNPNNGFRRSVEESSPLHLFKGMTKSPPYDSSMTYFRGDDEQRTLMSGQVLIRGLFGEEIKNDEEDVVIRIHTADRPRDVLSPNTKICPRLLDLREEAEASSEFQRVNSSAEAMELRQILDDLGSGLDSYGGEPIDEMVDCLMTTMCTDRTMPEGLDDYGSEESVFSRMMDFSSWKYTYQYLYNNSALSKLGMGPFWAELTETMKLTYKIKDITKEEREAPRLALYSGHDTTVMPLLASLGVVKGNMTWTPYASMLIFEVHAILEQNQTDYPSHRAFRLLYNGEILTPLIDGCPPDKELCDLRILFHLVKPFATRDGDCASTTTISDVTEPTYMEQPTQGKQDWVMTVMIALLSCVCSSLATFVYLTKRLPFQKGVLMNGLTPKNGIYGSTISEYEEEGDWSCTPEVALRSLS